MDYTVSVIESHYNLVRNFNKVLNEKMERENDIIMQCMETAEIIFEAVEEKKSFFKTVIDFLKRIRDAFLGKLSKLTDLSSRWLAKNEKMLQNINFDGLSVEVLPYWNINSGKLVTEAKKISNKVFDSLDKPVVENVEQTYFRMYGGGNGDSMADNFKQYFRFGNINKNIKPVTLSNNELKSKMMGEFIPYCKKYKTVFSPVIKQLVGDAERDLSRLEKELNKKSSNVTESTFITLGDVPLIDMGIVLEADTPEVKVNRSESSSNSNQNKDDKKDTKPKVTVNRATSTQDKSVGDLKYMRKLVQINQIAMASLMTAAEERFNAYWSIIKQVGATSNKGVELKKQD